MRFGPFCRFRGCPRRACMYGNGTHCVAHAGESRVYQTIAVNRALARQAGHAGRRYPAGHVHISERRKQREAEAAYWVETKT